MSFLNAKSGAITAIPCGEDGNPGEHGKLPCDLGREGVPSGGRRVGSRASEGLVGKPLGEPLVPERRGEGPLVGTATPYLNPRKPGASSTQNLDEKYGWQTVKPPAKGRRRRNNDLDQRSAVIWGLAEGTILRSLVLDLGKAGFKDVNLEWRGLPQTRRLHVIYESSQARDLGFKELKAFFKRHGAHATTGRTFQERSAQRATHGEGPTRAARLHYPGVGKPIPGTSGRHGPR